MSGRIDLVLSAGLEYYFAAKLDGHDAAYSPNGEITNQREEYTWAGADRAINQPKLQPRALIGVSFRL
jgi:hypothetical protein